MTDKFVVGAEAAQAQPPIVGNGQKVSDDGVTPALPRPLSIARVVDSAQVDQLLEAERGVLAQYLGKLQVLGGGRSQGQFAKGRSQVGRRFSQPRTQAFCQNFDSHQCGSVAFELSEGLANRPAQWFFISLLAGDRVGAAYLLLQLQDSVDQRFGGRRTARHVDVHRYDPVAAANHRVRVTVVAAAIGTRSPRDHPARFRHLVIYLAQGGGHLVAQRGGHDHHVRLSRTRPEHHAEAVQVVTGGARVHHLDRATRQAERDRPQRPGLGPVDQLVQAGRNEAFFENAFDNAHGPDLATLIPSPTRPFSIRRQIRPSEWPGTASSPRSRGSTGPDRPRSRPKETGTRLPGRTG